MISSEVNVKIIYNEEDANRIREAMVTINQIYEAFDKAGGYTETEKETLKHTNHILSSILGNETF